MRTANIGENKRVTPCLIEVSDRNIHACEELLEKAQKGLGLDSKIVFRSALKQMYKVINELPNGIFHIVYKKQKVASGPTSQAGNITKMAFFLYDTSCQKLMFCGFLRTRVKYAFWGTHKKNQIQTGIAIAESGEQISYSKTVAIEEKTTNH